MAQFFTEFGRINPTHPHAWKWLDQPIINTRLFGPDGMRGPGYRMSWLTPLPWYSQLYFGMQNANGETWSSFLSNDGIVADRPIGGYPFTDRPVKTLKDMTYLARVENSWDLSKTVTTKLGVSGVYGPNYTGPHGDTWIYGADLVVKWRPDKNYQGWPFLLFESEIMGRTFRADRSFFTPGDPVAGTPDIFIPGKTLRDWGFYAQLLWGFHPRWAVGCGVSMPVGAGVISHLTPSPRPHRSSAATPTPSGIIAPGSRRCWSFTRPNSPACGCNTTTTGRPICPAKLRIRSGWGWNSSMARTRPINIKKGARYG